MADKRRRNAGTGGAGSTAARRTSSGRKKESRLDQVKMNLGDSYYNLIISMIIMICLGLLTVYMATEGEKWYLIKQGLFAVLGLIFALVFIANTGTNVYKKFIFFIYVGSVVMIALLKTPLGVEVNGAVRWLGYGGITIQVVEIVKVAVILVTAFTLEQQYKDMDTIGLIMLVWIMAAFPALLIIVISSDLSSGLVILLIAFSLTLIVTKAYALHFGTGAVGIVAFYMMYIRPAVNLYKANIDDPTAIVDMEIPYRVKRILGWLYPEYFAQDFAYQTKQSLYAFGSAGLFGHGLGNTIATSNIPENHTDFILAQFVSSFGVLGLFCLLLLFVFLVYNIIYTASNARDNMFDALICSGVAAHFLWQNLINLCVVTGVFPNTGIPFIFMSYGNTGLLVNICEVGLVLCINKRAAIRLRKREMKKKR